MESTFAITATFVAYLLLMLFIGFIAWKKTSGSSDYFLGGRSLGPWPAALSAGASDMSGWLLLGLPGYAFASGFEAFWLAGGLLAGTWLNWLYVAKRLRNYTIAADNALTLPAFFTNRFKSESKSLQVVSAVFILLFFLFYTSSGLVAGGKLFETVFELDYKIAVVTGAGCIIAYTLFGGFLAVSWTDLVQGLLMAAALVIVPIMAMQIMDTGLFEMMGQMEKFNASLLNPFTDANGKALGWISVLSLLGWGLGYFGQPHILARFAAVRSSEDISTARRIAVTWSGLSMLGAMLVGFVGLLYVNAHMGGELGDGETIFMILVNTLFHPVVAGILLAAILAAVMSTADSQLLVSSSALAEDVYRAVVNKDATPEQVMKVGRFAVIGIALVALMLAMNPESSVLGLVSYAWAGFGAAFGPALVLSLFWSRMNYAGALAGIITGGVTVVVWKQLQGGWFDLYEIIPGIILATIAVIVASLVTQEPDDEVVQIFDQVAAES
ncbi:sodium/proline symporter PutP [Endozoicomonadaceae bacterium StTr2]